MIDSQNVQVRQSQIQLSPKIQHPTSLRCRSSRSRSSRSLSAFRSALVSLRWTGDEKGWDQGMKDGRAGDAAR